MNSTDWRILVPVQCLYWLILYLQVLASHMDVGSCPGYSTSHTISYLLPEKATEDGPKPSNSTLLCETQRKLLDLGFRLT